jgi:hypothetical protein
MSPLSLFLNRRGASIGRIQDKTLSLVLTLLEFRTNQLPDVVQGMLQGVGE